MDASLRDILPSHQRRVTPAEACTGEAVPLFHPIVQNFQEGFLQVKGVTRVHACTCCSHKRTSSDFALLRIEAYIEFWAAKRNAGIISKRFLTRLLEVSFGSKTGLGLTNRSSVVLSMMRSRYGSSHFISIRPILRECRE